MGFTRPIAPPVNDSSVQKPNWNASRSTFNRIRRDDDDDGFGVSPMMTGNGIEFGIGLGGCLGLSFDGDIGFRF